MLSKKKTISAAHNTIEKDEILNYSSSMRLYVYLTYLQDDSKSLIILFSQDDAIVGIKSIKID